MLLGTSTAALNIFPYAGRGHHAEGLRSDADLFVPGVSRFMAIHADMHGHCHVAAFHSKEKVPGPGWERGIGTLPMVAGSDSHFAAAVGLGVTDIQSADAEEAVAAIREGRTRVLGKRTNPKFFIGNTVHSICVIVKRGVRIRKRV